MRRGPVKVISKTELSTWNTKRLLGRLRRLRILEDSSEKSDMSSEEALEWSGTDIGFKDDARWSAAYKDLKTILSTRHHVE